MKTIKIIILMLSFVTFVSCSKDDDSLNIDPDVNIAGVWEMVNYDLNSKYTFSYEGENGTFDYSVTGKDYDYQVIFTENPNYVTSSGGYTSVITTSLLGEKNTQEVYTSSEDFENGMIGGTWRIEGNKLITIVDEVETSMDIKELIQNRIKLQMDLKNATLLTPGEMQDLEMEGIDLEVSGKINITLERN